MVLGDAVTRGLLGHVVRNQRYVKETFFCCRVGSQFVFEFLEEQVALLAVT